ncbi:MAG: DUF1624 domain-containing protein [Bacilli bacterium]|nr:DUF1624 domain-containing protein [Bacilli bacterium]
MICEASLKEEREYRIRKLDDKYQKKIVHLKLSFKEKIDKKCTDYALSHNQRETDLYRLSLELGANNKIQKLEEKYSKRVASFTVYLENRSKAVMASTKRIWEIDFLRGVAIWGMIIDHYIYDFYELLPNLFKNYSSNPNTNFLSEMLKFGNAYWQNDFRIFVRLFGVFLFVFLCGISCKFSKNNFKRGLGILGLGLVVTAALGIVSVVMKDPSMQIMLSTLTTIGLCILIYSGISVLFKKLCGKNNWKWICLGITVACFAFWGILSSWNALNNLGYSPEKLASRFFYVFNNNGNDVGWVSSGFDSLTAENWWKPVLGLKGFGADWLGLFPYLGYIFLGGFVGETVYKDKKSLIKFFYPKEERKLSTSDYLLTRQGQINAKLNCKLGGFIYPGKHTLFVYIFHQPVFLIIIIPILLLMGYQLALFG